MHVIVIGAGEVGTNIARHLVQENADVVMIDDNAEHLRHINETLDVKTLHGLGSHPDMLREAGAESADMLIAVTRSDEVNMVACQMAHTLFATPMKIARVRHRSYLSLTRQRMYTPENLPVDVIISPEVEVADVIQRTIDVPGTFDAAYFCDAKLLLLGAVIPQNAGVVGVPLRKLRTHLNMPLAVASIYRSGRMIVPGGADHIEAGDEVFFVCAQPDVRAAMTFLGFEQTQANRVFVIGGGHIGYDLCRRLENRHLNLRVLERDRKRAEYLAEKLAGVTVLHGDALDRELLLQENVGAMDAVISATNDDGANLLSTILAKQLGAKNVMTLVNHQTFIELAETLGIDKVISPREIVASRILQFVRRGQVMELHTLHDGMAEMIEAALGRSSKLVGQTVQQAGLPAGARIVAVYRPAKDILSIADDAITLQAGDRVVVMATAAAIHEVERLL